MKNRRRKQDRRDRTEKARRAHEAAFSLPLISRDLLTPHEPEDGLDERQMREIGQGARWFVAYIVLVMIAVGVGIAFCSHPQPHVATSQEVEQ